MDQNKKSIRLKSNQKKLLEIIISSKILEKMKIDKCLSINDITEKEIKELKQYNLIHEELTKLLEENKIEPNEIYDILNTYDGTNEMFKMLKIFILNRNLIIFKKIHESDNWRKVMVKLSEIFNRLFNQNTINYINDIMIDIISKDLLLYDITQYRLVLDGKSNLKSINITSLEDQKYIMTKLSEKGCKRKEK